MNSVVLIGNLTRDPELRYSTGANQTAICRFTIAVNDRRRNPQTQEWEDNASFIPIVVFGKQAENCDRYLSKGRKAAVSGRIQTGSYVNKEGVKVYTTEVIANNVEFLGGTGGSRSEGGDPFGSDRGFDQGFGRGQAPSGGGFSPQDSQADSGAQELPGGFQAIDDDIPF